MDEHKLNIISSAAELRKAEQDAIEMLRVVVANAEYYYKGNHHGMWDWHEINTETYESAKATLAVLDALREKREARNGG